MAVAEELTILVDAKVSAAVRDLKKVQKESDNLGGSFKKLGTIAKQFLPAVGIASVVVATKQLITLASAADESANAVNVTFGEAADTISDFGDTAANVVGLSKTDFSELATVIGAQLKQAGLSMEETADQTVDLTRRASDLASVFNVEVSEATTALGAALRGESEPARRFGINISDAAVQAEALASGLVSSKKEITDQIKVQARLNLIYQQSSDVAGDFENTSDGLANQSRILKANLADLGAELGRAFIPATENAVGALSTLVAGLKDAAVQARETRQALDLIYGRDTGADISAVERLEALRRGYDILTERIETQRATIDKYADSSDNRYRQIATASANALKDLLAERSLLERQIAGVAGLAKAEQDRANAAKENTDAVVEGAEKEIEKTAEIEEAQRSLWSQRTDWIEQWRDREIRVAEEVASEEARVLAERRAALEFYYSNVTGLATNFLGSLVTISNNAENAELQRLQSIVDATEEGTQAREDAENRLEERKKDIARKQAQRTKALGTLQATVDTAAAIIGFLADPGGFAGLALSAAAGAVGAAQIAAINSAPVPSFQSGTPVNQPFTVPGTPGRDSQPIMVEPGEEVTVNSRARSANSGSQMANVVLNIDGRAFGKVLLDLSRDRIVTIDRGALVAT